MKNIFNYAAQAVGVMTLYAGAGVLAFASVAACAPNEAPVLPLITSLALLICMGTYRVANGLAKLGNREIESFATNRADANTKPTLRP